MRPVLRQGVAPGGPVEGPRRGAGHWAGGSSRRVVSLLVLLVTLSSLIAPSLAASTAYLGIAGPGGSAASSSSSAGSSAGMLPLAVVRTLSANPVSGPVGTTVAFSASGFAHGSTFAITWTDSAGSLLTACSGKTSSTGTFSCKYTIPPTGGGSYFFTGKDAPGHTAVTSFTVLASLADLPTSGTVGTVVLVSGNGFTASGSQSGALPVPVSVTWLGSVVCSDTTLGTNDLGSFTCGFPLPPSPYGTHNLTATDASKVTASAPFKVLPTFLISPRYSPTGPGYGPAGSTIAFSGTGFPASSSVAVTWSVPSACSTVSTANGNFSCSYHIPSAVPGGNYTFFATTGASGATPFPFVVTYLNATPLTTTVNGTEHFEGGGFTPNAAYSVHWLRGTVASGNTTPNGQLGPFSFTTPLLPAGSYSFRAEDAAGRSAVENLTVVPSLTAQPIGGPPGTTVHFTGVGYAADSRVTVTWANGTACAQFTNASGWFRCSFTISATTLGGSYLFTGTDALSHAAQATFTVTYLEATPSAVTNGMSINVVGGGFAPDAPLVLTVGGNILTCAGNNTGSTGGFSCPVPVSGRHAGALLVVASVTSGGTTVTASTSVLVVPQLTVSPSASAGGTVGSPVTFSGNGFAPLSSVKVTWGTSASCQTTTSTTGVFVCAVALPPTPVGIYNVVAIDGNSNYAESALRVNPALTILPVVLGTVSTTIELSATGFAASSSISFTYSFGTVAGNVCSGTTDLGGTFNCTYAIPPSENGNLSRLGFSALDGGGDRASASFQVLARLTMTPTAGPVGSILTFTGTGFGTNALVNVTWSRGFGCSATSDSLGDFSCGMALPPTPAGHLTFLGSEARKFKQGNTTKWENITSSVTFTVMPHLSLSTASAGVGSPLVLTGTGFAAAASYSVTWAQAALCSGKVSTYGGFTCYVTVPSGTAGIHRLLATDTAGDAAGALVAVLPGLSIFPLSGEVGSNFTITGSGFAGGSTVTVTWSGGSICATTTSLLGSFACSVVMPPATAGAHSFQARDPAGDSAEADFTVLTSASAGLGVTPSGGPPGTRVTFTGNGFAPSANVSVLWAPGTFCYNTSSSAGSFSCTGKIPATTAGGVYAFTASDGVGDSASVTFDVTFLTVTPSSGPSNTTVTFFGGGFAANTTLKVNWTGGLACSNTTSSSGTFSCTPKGPLPAPSPGNYTFTATVAKLTATAVFRFLPLLTLNVTEAAVGASVDLTGTGFAPSADLTVTWDGTTLCTATTTTGSHGAFDCPFKVPDTVEGSHLLVATDAAGNSANATFAVMPALVPSPASGPVGTPVTFTGSGFQAGIGVAVNGSTATVCSTTTSATGDFRCSMIVPASSAGGHVYVASEGGPPVASGTFRVTPKLTLAPLSGRVGTTLSFHATGFASQVPIQVVWSVASECSGVTNVSGSFACTFAVPVGLAGGSVNFTAVDGAGNHASAPFQVISALSAKPDFGAAGTDTTFSGVGFAPSTLVTVSWQFGSACSSTTDAQGNFICTFTIPLGTSGGPHLFTATDPKGGTAAALFVVTFLSVSPSSGPIGTPLTFTGGGFGPTSTFTLSWKDGTVCTGLTDPTGAFRCSFNLTSATIGSYLFTVRDSLGDVATTTFTVVPALLVSPTSGPEGTNVTLVGSGFPGSTSVTVSWSDSTNPVCTPTTNRSGAFSCVFPIPSVTPGPSTFTAKDPAGDQANATFLVTQPLYTVSFTEVGLPPGTAWNVTVDGLRETGTTRTLNFTEPAGSFSYSDAATGFTGAPKAGSFQVSSGAVALTISFTVNLYEVTFDATGLSGQNWSVTLGSMASGLSTVTTTGASLTFDEPNGSYSYQVGVPANFRLGATSGSLTVNGSAPPAVTLAFVEVTYVAWVNQTKLPAGTGWSVTVNGVTSLSTSASIELHLPNGSYNWVVKAAGFLATPSAGEFTIAGASPAPVAIVFSTVSYAVSFEETGLIAGSPWTVTIGGSPHTTNASSLALSLTNATYTWKVAAKGYTASPNSGSFVLSGSSPAPVTIAFTQVTYQLTINETGLPAGDNWIVLISGITSVVTNSTTSTTSVQLPNGTYSILYGAPSGYAANPLLTAVTVAGKNKGIAVSFSSTSSPPVGFLGLTGNIANYVLYGTIGGAAAAAGAAGYLLARRGGPKKGLASDFL